MPVPLTRQSLTTLFPPRAANQGPSISATPPDAFFGAGSETAFVSPPFTVGPRNVGKYFRVKGVFGGAAKLKEPIVGSGGPATNALGFAVEKEKGGDLTLAVKYERAISSGLLAGWTFEGAASATEENLDKISQQIRSGNWRGACQQMFKGVLKTGVGKYGAIEFDLSPDEHLCFFGATGKVAYPVDLKDIVGSVAGNKQAEFEGAATFRGGLTELGWAEVARRIGGPLLRAQLARIGNALAQRAVTAAASSAGAFAIGAAVGVGIFYLTGVLIGAYSAMGQRMGVLSHYCAGYLAAIGYAQSGDQSMLYIGTRSQAHKQGWYDACRAKDQSSLRQVNRVLIQHFGSAYTWTNWYSAPVSQVGDKVDRLNEVKSLAAQMARYMMENEGEILRHLNSSDSGTFVQQTSKL